MLILSIVFSALYFLMVMYFLIGWLRLKQPQTTKYKLQTVNLPFVSIIVPVRNEGENIIACLDCLFNQNYPVEKFELIVIDDYSTDATLRLLQEYQRSNLLVLSL